MIPDKKPSIGVLVVDDDPNNVEILVLYLEDSEEGYVVYTGSDGVEGWETLQRHKDEINLILLDRMMPNMNGMQFMEKLKADDSVANIPVIMQTAAAEKEQVREGLSLGVYYYLTKPYDEEVMLSIVRAAICHYAEQRSLRNQLKEHTSRLHLVKECYFEVSTLDDIRYLSTFLANFYPNPNLVVVGLSELMLNALEHGNLGITYKDKTRLLQSNTWEQVVQHRQTLPEHKKKIVLIHFKRGKNITLTIKDEGKGFDWHGFMELDPGRATHCHGRGIALAKMLSFDTIEYKGCGNEVVCSVSL